MNLRRAVIGGLSWKAASQLLSLVIRLVTLAVLARLLTPREFGLAGMALVFSGLAIVLSDFALGSALVQRRDLTERARSTAFWAILALGTLLTGFVFGLSWPVARFYGEGDVQPLLAALSLGFLIGALTATPFALLSRQLDFRSLELSALAAVLLSSTTAVVLAALGAGPWALVGQELVRGTASGALVWVFAGWRPQLTFSFPTLRELSGVGLPLTGSRALFYVSRNLDNVLVGRFLGARALGFYSLAYNLMLVPLTRIVEPVRSVLFPAFARLQDDRPRLAETWLRVTQLLIAVLAPAMLGVVVVAPEAIETVLGNRWSPATTVIRVLALVALLQASTALCSVVLGALAETRILFRFAVLNVVAATSGIVAGIHWGIVGVAVGYAGANAIVTPVFAVVTARAVGIDARRIVRALGGVTQASALMLTGVVAAREGLIAAEIPQSAQLAVTIALGAALYVAACFWRAPELVESAKRLRRPRVEGG